MPRPLRRFSTGSPARWREVQGPRLGMRERSSLVSRISSRRKGDAKARSASGRMSRIRDTSRPCLAASPSLRFSCSPRRRRRAPRRRRSPRRRWACLPNDLDPVSAERARRRCRLTVARVPRRLTRRAAHAGGQARRDDPNAGLPAVGDRERRWRDLGGRPRPTAAPAHFDQDEQGGEADPPAGDADLRLGRKRGRVARVRRQRLSGARHDVGQSCRRARSSSATGRRDSPPELRRGCSHIATAHSCASTAHDRRPCTASRLTTGAHRSE